MPDAEEVGSLVHGQGEQAADLVDQRAVAFPPKRGTGCPLRLGLFLVHRVSSAEC